MSSEDVETKGRSLFEAIQEDDEARVKDFLRENPTFDVNWRNGDGDTALHEACYCGHISIISLLLAHPDIDPNPVNQWDSTPFWLGCHNHRKGQWYVPMLRDLRVGLHLRNLSGCTPLQRVASNGFLGIIKCWIALGREMDLGTPGDENTDAILAAGKKEHGEVVSLLRRFKEDPVETRFAARMELGLLDEMAVELFAAVIFVSDGLLGVRQGDHPTTPASRFFNIATQLPLELQMVLCFRAVGSPREIIRENHSEAAFQSLARILSGAP